MAVVSARFGLLILTLLEAGCGGRTALTHSEESRAPPGCLAAADEFLVLSAAGELYALRVPNLERRLITRQVCEDVEVNNMAVSREGGALIGLADGSFQALDAMLDCSAPLPVLTAFELVSYGMNFVGDGPDGETLFLNLNYSSSNHLATFDPIANEIRPVAEIQMPTWAMEIAGTPDGRLYGHHLGNFQTQSSVLQIDPESGAVLQEILTGPGLGLGSVALAVVDDAVYAFGAKLTETRSHVVRVDLASQRVTKLGSVPFIVSGAGASSCAARAALPSSRPLPAPDADPGEPG